MAYVSIAEVEMKAEHEVNLDAERASRDVTTVFPISLLQIVSLCYHIFLGLESISVRVCFVSTGNW